MTRVDEARYGRQTVIKSGECELGIMGRRSSMDDKLVYGAMRVTRVMTMA